MPPFLETLSQAFTWQKLVYTLVLLGIILLLSMELRRLWFEKPVALGSFKFLDEASLSKERAEAFAVRVANQHSILREKFASAAKLSPDEEATLSPRIGAPIQQAETVLADVEITVQQVNVSAILARLRRWVSTPAEVTGIVRSSGNRFHATVVLPARSGRFVAEPLVFHVEKASSLEELSLQTACGLIWSEAARSQEEIRVVPREEFCAWTRLWDRYLDLEKKSYAQHQAAERHRLLEELHGDLTASIESGVVYPKFYQLRAAVVDLMGSSADERRLVQAQNDRLRYAVLLGRGTDQPAPEGDPLDEQAALAILARARPAIPLEPGLFGNRIPEGWRSRLEPARELVHQVARSVGFVSVENPSSGRGSTGFVATGFVIAPDVVATTAALQHAMSSSPARSSGTGLRFSFGTRADADPSRTFAVTRILHMPEGSSLEDQLALLEVRGMDPSENPPLDLAGKRELAAIRSGDLIAVVGYAAHDPRLPKPFLELVFADRGHYKRLMPGHVIARTMVPDLSNPADIEGRSPDWKYLVTDATTSGGTAGGPLVSLASGKVIGMHTSGLWRNIHDGKFAMSETLTRERVKALRSPEGEDQEPGGQ